MILNSTTDTIEYYITLSSVLSLSNDLFEGQAGDALGFDLTEHFGVNQVAEHRLRADHINTSSNGAGGVLLDLSLGNGGLFMDVLKNWNS